MLTYADVQSEAMATVLEVINTYKQLLTYADVC
jgi:hypothetical protein